MRRRRNLETIAGRVAGNATVKTGSDFTVRSGGTGVFAIAFNPNFRLISFVATSESGGRILGVVYTAENSVTVTSYLANTLGVDGQPFGFVATGVQQ